MLKKTKPLVPDLPTCKVWIGKSWWIGALFFQNQKVVVLINNVNCQADLGPLKKVRVRHVEPEADILILPRDQIYKLELLQLQSGSTSHDQTDAIIP